VVVYVLCLMFFLVGIYCILRKRNIIKIIVGVIISEYAVNLFFLLVGYKSSGRSPILCSDRDVQYMAAHMVDPLPQAVVLTSIVIGLATTALLVAIAMRIYGKYRTFDITKIRELKG